MTTNKHRGWFLVGNIASICTILATVTAVNEKILGPTRGNLILAIAAGFLVIILACHIPKVRVKWVAIVLAICLTLGFIGSFASTFFVGFPLGSSVDISNPIKLAKTPSHTVFADSKRGDSLVIRFAVPEGRFISVAADTLEESGHKPTCNGQNVSDIKKPGKGETEIASILFKDTRKVKGCKVKIVTDSDSVFVTYEYYKRTKVQRISQWIVRHLLYFRS